MNQQDIDTIIEQGARWAESVAPGALFRGCMGEARHRFPNDPTRARLFFGAAVAAAKWDTVKTDGDGVVTSVEWLEPRKVAGVQ